MEKFGEKRSGNPTSFNTDEVELISTKMFYVWGWAQQYKSILLKPLLSTVLPDSTVKVNLNSIRLFIGKVKSIYSK